MANNAITFNPTIQVAGRFVKKIIDRADDYSINLVRITKKGEIAKLPPELLKGQEDRDSVYITVHGNLLPDCALEIIYEIGSLNFYKGRYGANVTSYRYVTPETSRGLITYLSSKMFKGIGKSTAQKIVDTLGVKCLDKIYENPSILYTVPKLGPKLCKRISDSVKETYAFNELGVFVGKYGISTNNITKISTMFGSEAVSIIKDNPYSIMGINGLGFKVADRIAIGEHVALDSEERIQNAILSILEDDSKLKAEMFMDRDQLEIYTLTLLNGGFKEKVVDKKKYLEVFNKMMEERTKIVVRGAAVYLKENDECEQHLSRRIVAFLSKKVPEIDIQRSLKAFEEVKKGLSYSLSSDQENAVVKTLSNKFSILTGGPGVGKTTTVKVMVKAYKMVHPDHKVGLLAPTGKAATLLQKSVGMGLRGHTIHHSCQVFEALKNGSPQIKLPTPGLYIIDESSMIDMDTARVLLDSIDLNCHVIFCGDPDQLPSVGKGSFLHQMLQSHIVPVAKLTQVHRQSGDAMSIVDNAYAINNGKTDLIEDGHFRIFRVNSDDEAKMQIQNVLSEGRKKYGDDIAILAPRNKKKSPDGSRFFPLAVEQLNHDFQQIINPACASANSIRINGTEFRKGDKIIQMRNTQIANNGDTGIIQDVILDAETKSVSDAKVVILFDNQKEPVTYDYLQMFDVNLAYAISIHKSQGSQYAQVIIPLLKSHKAPLYTKTLLYTAVTRAKDEVVIIGDDESIKYCIKNFSEGKRNTYFSVRLQNLEKRYQENLAQKNQ